MMQAAFLINFRSSDSQIVRGRRDTVNAVRGVNRENQIVRGSSDDPRRTRC